MSALDAATIRRLVELAADRLYGDWLVVGGASLPLIGIAARVTADVDVVGPETATQADTVALMRIAVDLGLPPETINQSAAFLLHAVDGWEAETEVLIAGAGATIRVPTATLFVLSKLGRLSEVDLADCLAVLEHAAQHGRSIDRDRLRRAAEAELDEPGEGRRRDRLRRLLDRL